MSSRSHVISVCPDGTTCQQLNTPDLTLRGVVCAPPADRNRTCAAVFDEDACTVGDCIPTDIELNDDNTLRRGVIEVKGQKGRFDLTGWGEPVQVKAPPASKVMTLPSASASANPQ